MTQKNRIQPHHADDADIVGEAVHAASEPLQVAPPLPYENLALVVLLLLLGGGVLALAHTASLPAQLLKPHPPAYSSALPTPVVVAFPSVDAIRILPAQNQSGNLSSFNGALNQAKLVRQQANGLSKGSGRTANIPPVGSHLTMATYKTMRTYLANKEGITETHDAHDVLLKAGYTLPKGLSTQNNTKRNHVAFARDVIRALVKDEVESFLHKVNVVSKVGAYAVDQK